LPFYRERSNIAFSIADTLTDFQGMIAPADLGWNPGQLVRDCRLSALHLDHVPVAQRQFQPFYWTQADSPYMNLAGGFETYCKSRARPKSDELRHVLRKTRKLEREIGPVRLQPFTADARVLQKLLDWKAKQYDRTNTGNVFSRSWTVALLERLLMQRDGDFAGMLSALYVGDRLAAAHMGMVSHGVLHWWFPAYDVELRKYSPGLVHLVQVAQQAQSLGIRRIDLGKGPEAFKKSFMSGATGIAEAVVDVRPVVRSVRRWWLRTQDYVRASRFERQARVALKNVRTWLGSARIRARVPGSS
jgi:CelD/BcsL family acetyltransferase involved in cellulose biosynthesis